MKTALIVAFVAVVAVAVPSRVRAQDDLTLVAAALISSQIRPQVQRFNQLVRHVSSVKVVQMEDLDVITLQGTMIRGGDMACGTATLTIKRTFEPQPPLGTVAERYTAQIEAQSSCLGQTAPAQ